MKTKILITSWVGLLVISVVSIGALIPTDAEANEKVRAQGNDDKVPPGLKKLPPGLEKIVFIHYKKGHGKPADKPGKPEGGKGEKGPKCYEFFGKGLKWKELPTRYVIHPDLNATAIELGADAWDDETFQPLFSTYTLDSTANWDSDTPDGRNEFVFGDYSQAGVIAVTVVWGYFSGPPGIREIFEFDILFDTDYTWGDAKLDEDKMDLQNIAAHEIGHGLGLADIYKGGCTEVTMYGYSSNGETKKRTLADPDITGIQELYGP